MMLEDYKSKNETLINNLNEDCQRLRQENNSLIKNIEDKNKKEKETEHTMKELRGVIDKLENE